ncbi:PAS domain-containing protein [Piscirickettsia litoralis]|uniref:PAS domain-containing protein n=1 Tax=Piscirickettsia litoralis TaxID=1891921 RepID=UPI001300EA11|nr:PAS domain-containing protein [Piscirickettsia litoralis]
MLDFSEQKLYTIVDNDGNIMFINELYQSVCKINREEVLGKKVVDFITVTPKISFMNQVIKDRYNILIGSTNKITRHAVFSTKHIFGIVTNNKIPLINSGEVVGIINETDLGINQLVNNRIFLTLPTMEYHGETLSPTDMKMLCMFAQFPSIKPIDISNILGLKLNTVYMYRHGLINKLRNTLINNKRDFARIAQEHFFKGVTFEEGQVYCTGMRKK